MSVANNVSESPKQRIWAVDAWDDGGMNGLSAQGLADLAGVTEAEVVRLVELGILVARDGAEPFLEVDVPKVRLAVAYEQAGSS